MKIISFAWTTPALLSGVKTVTRRQWNDDYARSFRPGDVCQAWDKSPRFFGKHVADIVLESVKKLPWHSTPDSDYEAEGFNYLAGYYLGNPKRPPVPLDKRDFDEWRDQEGEVWVVRFRLLAVLDETPSPVKETPPTLFDVDETLAKFQRDIAERRCVSCGREVTRYEKVGRCTYAYPCQHRQYQGDPPKST